MAEELNFSIEDTMEMGSGDSQLLNDLISPETSTAKPGDITEIVKTVEDEDPKKKEAKPPKGKDIVQKLPGEEKTQQDILTNFLGDNSEEDDDGDGEEGDADDKGDIKNPKTEKPEDTNEGDSTFKLLAKELKTLGVFTDSDEGEEEVEPETPQEFLERFQSESKKSATNMVDKFIGQFGEDYQNAFEAIFVNGVHPKDYFSVYNTITDFASLDMAIEGNQIEVVKQALKDQQLEPEDITDEVERLTNSGDLETVALRYHKALIKKGALNLQQMEQKAAQELKRKAADKEQYNQNVKQVIQDKVKAKEYDGIPINPKLASELHDFLVTDKWRLPSGETLTDFDRAILELKKPENHAQKVKIGLLLKTMEKDPTLSTIIKAGVTKKSDQLFSDLVKQKKEVKQSSVANDKPATSWFK